jgi:molybdopterin-containing oxidoreductase family iron-sulfur binding subunit
VACNAENNVSVVGKPEVLRGHEMHWLRIDRYFSGDMDNPNVVFQPLMCQHCDMRLAKCLSGLPLPII